jgi:hypothetical protein
MDSGKLLPRLLLLSSLVALLALSFIFDFIASRLEIISIEGGGSQSVLVILLPIFQLVLVLGGLALFWYLITSPRRNRLESWIFMLVGLLLVFTEALLFFLPVPMSYYALAQLLAPGTFLFLGASLVCVAGALNLALKGEEKPLRVEEVEPIEGVEI